MMKEARTPELAALHRAIAAALAAHDSGLLEVWPNEDQRDEAHATARYIRAVLFIRCPELAGRESLEAARLLAEAELLAEL